LAALNSCTKEADNANDTALGAVVTAADDEIVNISFDEATSDSDEAEVVDFSKKGNSVKFQDCATVTKTKDGDSKTLVIDYGTEGCTSPRGHIRKGKVIINLTGTRLTTGFVKTIEFENFYLDGNLIEGKRTLTTTLNGLNLAQHVVVDGGRVTLTDGVVITFDEDKTRTLVEGLITPLVATDDVWEVTGTASGMNYNQVEYSMLITKPIRRSAACKYAVSGTKVITTANHTATLDFGDGSCDNKATVTVGDLVKEIVLGSRWK
jgi:hypothetical protein